MRTFVRAGWCALAAGVILVPCRALADAPRTNSARATAAPASQDAEFLRVLGEFEQRGEDPGVLAQRGALTPFSDAVVASLLQHRNRYIKAVAISELEGRGDASHRVEIHKLFRETALDVGDLRPDPHDSTPLPAEAALLIAAAEYLAAADKGAFLPDLLDRAETWAAPLWFAPAFRRLGPGWISAALNSCQDTGQRATLGFFIRASATNDNMAELREVLLTEKSAVWLSAVVACERLDDPACWLALDTSIDRREAAERLAGRMAQWRRQRTTPEELFAAAESVAQAAAREAPGPARARLWNELDKFVRMADWTHLAMPSSLAVGLRGLGSPVIAKDLDAAGND